MNSKIVFYEGHSKWNHTPKKGTNPIDFILSTQSGHPMRVHNPEYKPPGTSGSRVTGCTNFGNYQKSANFK